MKRVIAVSCVLLLGFIVAFLGYPWISDRASGESDRVYREYDQKFRTYLANATQIVGKETIKVERLSDQFTVPQKLTIKGTPYEIGLTIGHIGKQAKERLPLVDEKNRELNQKLAELYRKIHPQHLDVVRGVASADERVALVAADHAGKAAALNLGLACASTPLIATVDADTLLVPSALRRIVVRLLVDPDGTVAVAGAVLVRNSRRGLVARMQEWDYQLGIAAVKRQQALLGATLVAQGAFSVYRMDEMRRAGGWPDRIGEDIVATWALIEHGGRVAFEPTAVAFTSVPTSLRRFTIQRQRWARGMIEGLNTHGSALLRRRGFWVHSVVADAIFPFLDLTYTLAVPAGIVLAALGNFAIVGPMTLAVLPLNLAMAGALFARERAVFAELGLHVRRNRRGFLAYFLLYQLIQSPISVSGYILELRGARRVW